jgi:hypothetical protein
VFHENLTGFALRPQHGRWLQPLHLPVSARIPNGSPVRARDQATIDFPAVFPLCTGAGFPIQQGRVAAWLPIRLEGDTIFQTPMFS